MTDHNDPRDPDPRDPDDHFERALREAAKAGEHRRSDLVLDGHLTPELMVAHLQRTLGPASRQRVVSHLADCGDCCDRLLLAADLLKLEPLPSALQKNDDNLPEDVGPALMDLVVAIESSSLRVVRSDAEMRVGLAAATRRGQAPAGVAFSRTLHNGSVLQLELLEARQGKLNLSSGLSPTPRGARISLIERGKLSQTQPLKRGRAIFRDLPLDVVYLRLEVPGQTLGHVRLELSDERGTE